MISDDIKREHIIRHCTPTEIYEVVTDYDAYPRIFPEFRHTQLLEQHDKRQRLAFTLHLLIDIKLVLDIVHDEKTLSTTWTFVEGDLVAEMKGGWKFLPRGEDTYMCLSASASGKSSLPRLLTNKLSHILLAYSIPKVFRALEDEVRARQALIQQ